MPSENNKRIAKNTLFLYARMIVVMVISLYTVRVILNALGPTDYGIYNVVGGIVLMFSFLTSSLVSTSQRFFAYTLGCNDKRKLSQYFMTSIWCHVIIVLIVLIIGETAGLYFVINKLTIPSNRLVAALWVYQFTIASFIINMIAVPYNSILIAHERMNIYAIVGLVEAIVKLGCAYLIVISPIDKLIMYAFLIMVSSIGLNLFYIMYCTAKFKECKLMKFWDYQMFKEVISFSGWSLYGGMAGIIRSQGINILINIYFNPIVNAARAIAYQVNSAMNQFVLNFFKAVQPQITKYYAASELDELFKLIFRSSRFSYYLFFCISLPIYIASPEILKLWLKEVPQYTVIFTRLAIVVALVDSMSYPLQTAISATGKIKWYQMISGTFTLLNLPISWIFLYYGFPPQITMCIAIFLSLLSQISRLIFSKYLFNLSISDYCQKVIKPILIVSFISIGLSIITMILSRTYYISFLLSFCICCLATFFIGMSKKERHIIVKTICIKLKIPNHFSKND